MEAKDVLELYRTTGAYQEGHFLLSSGLHSNRYFQSALVLMDPARASRLCEAVAGRVRDLAPQVILGPAMGGIVVAHEIARALGCLAMFAEREATGFSLRRGFSLEKGERVLAAEDVLTTGRSVRELLPAVESAGAQLVGIACLVDRRGEEAGPLDLEPGGRRLPVRSLLQIAVPTYRADDCPLCAAGSPAVKPGSRPRS